MAMIDYGAIAWKDGKCISTGMFDSMIECVGWRDGDEKDRLDNNYFTYIGDKDLTLAFYKCGVRICRPDYSYEDGGIWFGGEKFARWKYWHDWFYVHDDLADIKIYPPKWHHNYYRCKMKYHGHKYKVAFGYGVDYDYYKRCHIINYYGTPWFIIRQKCHKFKDWLKYDVWNWNLRYYYIEIREKIHGK